MGAGDAGEGLGGTDRTNIVQMFDMKQSYPMAYDKEDSNFFTNSNCFWATGVGGLNPEDYPISAQDAQVIMASGGYYKSWADVTTKGDTDVDGEATKMDPLLNNVSASFRGGLVCCATTPG